LYYIVYSNIVIPYTINVGSGSAMTRYSGLAHIIAIYKRAGWSIGKIAAIYLQSCDGGDQVCGRLAALLDPTSLSFSALPPIFKRSENGSFLTYEELETMIPGFANYPPSCKAVIPHVLAVAVVNSNYLETQLPESHEYFKSIFYIDNHPQRLLSKLVGTTIAQNGDVFLQKRTFMCPESNITATGIPPMLVLARQFHEGQERIENHLLTMQNKMDGMFESMVGRSNLEQHGMILIISMNYIQI